MYGLRSALLAALILALQGYLVVAGYACSSLVCPAGAYWLALMLWLGVHLGILARCKLSVPFLAYALLLGYGGLVLAVALIEGWLVFAVLASTVLVLDLLAASGADGSCTIPALAASITGYQALVSLVAGVAPDPPGIVPVAVLEGFLLTTLYIDAFLASRAGRRTWTVLMALGFAFLAVAGVAAAYSSIAYRLVEVHNIRVNCTWARFCVELPGREVAVPPWLYTLILFIQLAYTGAILALPVSSVRGSGGAARTGGRRVRGDTRR